MTSTTPAPTITSRSALPAWQMLQAHAEQMGLARLRNRFDNDIDRDHDFPVGGPGIYADFSKNLVTRNTLRLLTQLALRGGLGERIADVFAGRHSNTSEQRVPCGRSILVDGTDVVPAVHQVLDSMASFAELVRGGHWLGPTGKPIRSVITNARAARDWLVAAVGGDTCAVTRHFVTVSTNAKAVSEFGIAPQNMFGFWDRVGGVDSAVGISLIRGIGPQSFTEPLAGFHGTDEHFRTTPIQHNVPVLMGLLSVRDNNLLGAQSQAVPPDTRYFAEMPAYPKQLVMESDGKQVTRAGERVDYQTGPVIRGQAARDMNTR